MKDKGNGSTKIWFNGFESIMHFSKNVLPAFYVFTILLGAVFAWAKYSREGINIFEYATVFDFIVMPLRNKLSIFFAIIPFAGLASLLHFEHWYEKYKKRNPNSKWVGNSNTALDRFAHSIAGKTLLFIVYLLLVTRVYGDLQHHNLGFSPLRKIEFNDGTTLKGLKFGQTENYIFLYTNTEIVAVPLHNEVKKITLENLDSEWDIEEFKEEQIDWLNKEASTVQRWRAKFVKFLSN